MTIDRIYRTMARPSALVAAVLTVVGAALVTADGVAGPIADERAALWALVGLATVGALLLAAQIPHPTLLSIVVGFIAAAANAALFGGLDPTAGRLFFILAALVLLATCVVGTAARAAAADDVPRNRF